MTTDELTPEPLGWDLSPEELASLARYVEDELRREYGDWMPHPGRLAREVIARIFPPEWVFPGGEVRLPPQDRTWKHKGDEQVLADLRAKIEEAAGGMAFEQLESAFRRGRPTPMQQVLRDVLKVVIVQVLSEEYPDYALAEAFGIGRQAAGRLIQEAHEEHAEYVADEREQIERFFTFLEGNPEARAGVKRMIRREEPVVKPPPPGQHVVSTTGWVMLRRILRDPERTRRLVQLIR